MLRNRNPQKEAIAAGADEALCNRVGRRPRKNTVRKWVERFHHRRQKEPGRPVKEYLCDVKRERRPPEFTAELWVQFRPKHIFTLRHAVELYDNYQQKIQDGDKKIYEDL